jgi:hypothetical protein
LKKILIIAMYWGTRIPGLAKYLPEFGWQPFVLTPHLVENPDIRFTVIQTPYRDAFAFWKRLFRYNPNEGKDMREQLKRRLGVKSNRSLINFAFTMGNEIFAYPDAEKGWKPFAIEAGRRLLQREKIDAMISSSSPATSHLIASKLKTEYQVPWVADMRDLWSQNHNYQYGPLRKWIDTRLEVKTLSTADALLTVSEPWAEKLKMLHKGKSVYVITNGFDPAEVNEPPAKLTAKFTITYPGRIYPGKQAQTKLFAALRDIIFEGVIDPRDVEIRFYGPRMEWLDKEIEHYALSRVVKQYGVIPRQVALEKQRESHVLLLLNWDAPNEKGWYPLKIFEYLAAQRTIVSIGGFGNDMVEALLKETKAGVYCKTVEDIKSALRVLYLEYKQKGRITYTGDMEKINKYSHREMARRYAETLNRLT